MFYQQMLEESRNLEAQLKTIQSSLNALPKENFFCTHSGKYHKWYKTDGKKQTYIPKKQRKLAEKLALKKYLSCLSQDISHEHNAISLYLRHHLSNPKTAEKILQDPAYKELLSKSFLPKSQYLIDWVNSPYERSRRYPEQLVVETASGIYVRSKSEALIDMILTMNRIPFRYECALQLGDIILYPDFTILHPQKNKLYYWEHFGLVDKPAYCNTICTKLQTYMVHGIIPTIQLITTYETQEQPLSSRTIEKIVKDYFL